ncbi:MAG TPA: hypothetical protein VFC17_02995 [Candidatus Limnocylindrales bacterium]|nr:hypothetical protein [Candidatus Limnocylindrales bacterium]
MAATGEPFAGNGVPPEFATTAGTGRSPTFVPVRINFGSSDAGACGAVIFWKHVGHSITEPPCDESHIMCWPHTGHAYLNSLMLRENISHSPPDGNVHFSSHNLNPDLNRNRRGNRLRFR